MGWLMSRWRRWTQGVDCGRLRCSHTWEEHGWKQVGATVDPPEVTRFLDALPAPERWLLTDIAALLAECARVDAIAGPHGGFVETKRIRELLRGKT